MLPLEHDERAKYEECCDSLALCRVKSRRQRGNVARVAEKNAGNACRMWAQRSIAVAIDVVFFNFSSSTTHFCSSKKYLSLTITFVFARVVRKLLRPMSGNVCYVDSKFLFLIASLTETLDFYWHTCCSGVI